MSTYEYIFLKTDASPDAAGEELARALGMELLRDREGVVVWAPGFGGLPGRVQGGLSPNFYGTAGDDPEDRSAIDGYRVVWKIWRSNSDEEMQLEIAWAIFQELTRTVRWPAALVHGLDLLVATWDPDRGLRRFPPLTTVDLQDEPIWR
jgi:hypothetical protein